MSDITILFARLRKLSLDTGYGLTQARLTLERQTDWFAMADFDRDSSASQVLNGVETPYALVLTDALGIASPSCVGRMLEALEASPDADAVVPMTNITNQPEQLGTVPGGAQTLRQFEDRSAREAPRNVRTVTWNGADPGLFLCRTDRLNSSDEEITSALGGHTVAIAESAFLYRYASQRSFVREDILSLVPTDAKRVLEIGCGEGRLGAAIKARQKSFVSGVEIDERAARVAEGVLDEVFVADVRDVVRRIDEKFDAVVGGDILEHLEDPWEFLRELKRVVEPGGVLLLSIPNVAFWPVVQDLLLGRFDYIYAGPICIGHLRFYTRKTIEDTLHMAQWNLISTTAHPPYDVAGFDKFTGRMDAAGIPWSREDLATPGWYILARNQ
ncbi:MAG: class I SAM-dependent methyltransferase [Acidobacteria bacterium]|nr:class I SAM-dependent methyltransferase [Acidobacteriota bacterium]